MMIYKMAAATVFGFTFGSAAAAALILWFIITDTVQC